MPLDAAAFRHTMGSLTAGVSVITIDGPDGSMGMTATSVTSLSLEPPLLLVCVGHDAEIHDIIVRASVFGVAMLGAGQAAVAVRFATRGEQRIGAAEPRTPAGLPRIPGAIATIDCVRRDVLEGGDHSIVIGQLEWADVSGGAPLLHFRGRYVGLAP